MSIDHNLKMANGIVSRSRHCAVQLDNYVVILGGVSRNTFKPLPARVISKYNLYTEAWSEYVIPQRRDAPEPFTDTVAVKIGGTIYTFGGMSIDDGGRAMNERNELWTFKRTEKGGFTWSCIKPQCKEESPSPRYRHTGWEYEGKLWIFGGKGQSPEGYLNYNGDILEYGYNNQLLCYDPNTQKWTNPQSFGDVPSPRADHASTIIKNKLWLYGGIYNVLYGDMFELAMDSLTWTQVQIVQPGPEGRMFGTLTAVTEDQLVLHGGLPKSNDTWIMDLTSHSWRMYASGKDHSRWYHTGSLDLTSSVIIFGGCKTCDTSEYNNIFHVMLELSSYSNWQCK